jgi:hypothetical protein
VVFVCALDVIPRYDQKYVLELASQLIEHDNSSFQQGEYAYNYPYQAVLALFYIPFVKIFGSSAATALQFANIPALIVADIGIYKIVKLLFEDEKLATYSYLGVLLFFPISCYTTFVYGTLYGLCFAIVGVWMVVKYLKTGKLAYGVLGAFLMTVGYMLKNNYMIFVIAVVLVLLYDMIVRRKLHSFIVAALCIVMCVCSGYLTTSVVSSMVGVDYPDGVPKGAWLATGLCEGSVGSGTYNKSVGELLYEDCDYDYEVAEAAEEYIIQERIDLFKSDLSYTAQFFASKLALEWNNGTFECFWINTLPDRGHEWSRITETLMIDGSPLNRVITYLCNLFLSFLWLGILLFVFYDKDKNVYKLLLPVIFIGGFVFHTFWEAKSQYTIIYVYLMIPYMIRGYQAFVSRCMELKGGLVSRRVNKAVSEATSGNTGCAACKNMALRVNVAVWLIALVLVLLIKVIPSATLDNCIRLSGDEEKYENYLDNYWENVKAGTESEYREQMEQDIIDEYLQKYQGYYIEEDSEEDTEQGVDEGTE